jgi:hypothetical protein
MAALTANRIATSEVVTFGPKYTPPRQGCPDPGGEKGTYFDVPVVTAFCRNQGF